MPQQVTLGLELPIGAQATLDNVITELAKGQSIEVTKPEGQPGAPGSALRFEPITGAVVGWFIIKLAGDTAIALAGHLIAELVFRRMKGQKELARAIVPVRFPDGTIFQLQAGDDTSLRTLENMIAEKSRR